MKARNLLLITALLWAMAPAQAQYPDYPGGYDPTIGQPTGAYGYEDESGYYSDDDDYGNYGQRIQLALVLDASGSMDRLIDQARTQLWTIVNELWWSYDDGSQPRIEIALYAYGSTRFNPRSGYLQQLVPFTHDLDWVSDELYSIRTGGRVEYAGWVIQDAVYNLNWSPYPQDLKLLYIAGNEHFQQGPVNYRQAIREAQQKGVTVNTIYCGPYNEGISRGWQEAARYGGGAYANIDLNGPYGEPGYHNSPSVSYNYNTVYQLNVRLNNTYVPYGPHGHQYFQRLQRQDQYVGNYGQWCLAQRALTKASGAYHVYHWDLVAAYHAGRVDLNRIPDRDLPPAMRGMSTREKQQYLIKMQAERARIQEDIRRTARRPDRAPATASNVQGRPERPSHTAAPGPRTLDQAIVNTTRAQASQARSTPRPAQAQTPGRRQPAPVQRFDAPQSTPRTQPSNRIQPAQVTPPSRGNSSRGSSTWPTPGTTTTRNQQEVNRPSQPESPVRRVATPAPQPQPSVSRPAPAAQPRVSQPQQPRSTPSPATRSTPQVQTRSSQPAATPAAPSRRVEPSAPVQNRSSEKEATGSRRPTTRSLDTRR